MKRVKFIYNPKSGENTIPNCLDRIIEAYQRRGLSIVPYRLTFDGQMQDIIGDLDDSYSYVLVAGGDGTVNYVINLLKKNGVDIPVAVLPAGTANDFAMHLGLSPDPLRAVEQILDGQERPVDLGKVNDDYFVNVFSCGLFTDISQKTPTILKNTFGKLAYYVGGIGELTRFRKLQVKIETDRGNYEGNSIIFFIFNGRTAGNLNIAYNSEIDDGLLDVLILKGDNTLETVQTFLHYMNVIGNHRNYPVGIEHIQCSRLTATCRTDETTDMDGQPGPAFPLEVSCEKGALRLIYPKPLPVKQPILKIKRPEPADVR